MIYCCNFLNPSVSVGWDCKIRILLSTYDTTSHLFLGDDLARVWTDLCSVTSLCNKIPGVGGIFTLTSREWRLLSLSMPEKKTIKDNFQSNIARAEH